MFWAQIAKLFPIIRTLDIRLMWGRKHLQKGIHPKKKKKKKPICQHQRLSVFVFVLQSRKESYPKMSTHCWNHQCLINGVPNSVSCWVPLFISQVTNLVLFSDSETFKSSEIESQDKVWMCGWLFWLFRVIISYSGSETVYLKFIFLWNRFLLRKVILCSLCFHKFPYII